MFSPAVAERLGYYVYRLMDPRNGETFYVGKGTGNRVFAHAMGEIAAGDDDALSQKLLRIRQIRLDGFEVAHVIHRHGMDEATAFEVEAALIDAYPEAEQLVGGHGSSERGLMHSKQIIERYEAPPAVFQHQVVLINVNQWAAERGVYEAVRYAWKLDPKRAEKAAAVLAVRQGLIIDAFVAERWMPATVENFPGTVEDLPGRWGFVGRPAPEEMRDLYVRHRLPDEMRRRGAANPVRYAP